MYLETENNFKDIIKNLLFYEQLLLSKLKFYFIKPNKNNVNVE